MFSATTSSLASLTSAPTRSARNENEDLLMDESASPDETGSSGPIGGIKRRDITTDDSEQSLNEITPRKQLKRSDAVEEAAIMNDQLVIRAGCYLLGHRVTHVGCPLDTLKAYVAQKEGTMDFYVVKILTLPDTVARSTQNDFKGKQIIHNEHAILSMLRNVEGVIHEHGIFREQVEINAVHETAANSVKMVSRLCLVLDCYDRVPQHSQLSSVKNLLDHVMEKGKLQELEAIRLFGKILKIVEQVHKLNFIHRDLKLGNCVFDSVTGEVKLANFIMGKHLSRPDEPLTGVAGSPAYAAPEIYNRKAYLGKPTDMWSLGVLLYSMLAGQFPFYDRTPKELFRKVKLGQFVFPEHVNIGQKTVELIQSLLALDPRERLTASQALHKVEIIINEDEQDLQPC